MPPCDFIAGESNAIWHEVRNLPSEFQYAFTGSQRDKKIFRSKGKGSTPMLESPESAIDADLRDHRCRLGCSDIPDSTRSR